ncbi:MAG: type II secretion system protein [Bacilli bacterium]
MKNKGFTLVEMLAVIVILGILSSLAVVGVSKYRQTVKEKELVNLNSTIEDAYDKYRSDLLMTGKSYLKTIDFNIIDGTIFNKYFSELTYSGDHLKKADLEGSIFKLVVKGDLLNITDYTEGKDEATYVKDGTCLVTSKISDKISESETTENEKELVKECQETSGGTPLPSQEEMLCVKLVKNDEVLIDDFADTKNLCYYFRGE